MSDNKKQNKPNVPTLRFPEFSGEWKKERLSKSCDTYDGTHQTPQYTQYGVPFFSVEDITALREVEKKYISEKAFKRDYKIIPRVGDLLMTRIGDIGTSMIIETDAPLAYYVSLALIRPNSIDSRFLNSYIASPYFKKELYKRTIHVAFPKKINKEDIGKCIINHPNKIEQEKIGNLLYLINERVNIQNKVIKDLIRIKESTTRRLLRHKDESCRIVTLGEITEIVSRRNKDRLNYPMYSVTNDKGFIPQTEQFEDREMLGDDIGNYKIIQKNEIAYNPARINVGSIAQYTEEKPCMISSLYVCIKAKENINSKWLIKVLKSEQLINYYNLYAEGGVRLYLFYPNFSRIKVALPSTTMQQRISDALETIDNKIELESSILYGYMRSKQSLLKSLFI